MFVHVTTLTNLVCVFAHVARSASLFRSANVNENGESGNQRKSIDTLGFLEHYGYLQQSPSDGSNQIQHSEAGFSQAVRDFQRFTGLEVTGRIDQQTLTKMRQPRCGFPDILGTSPNSPLASGSGPSSPQNFETLSTRWKNDTVTWKFVQMSRKLPRNQQLSTLERALRYWSDVTPLQFRRTEGHADMEIMFARGEHGDGPHNRFNGPGGILAHAFRPGVGIGGDTHFDEDEDWTLGIGQGTDMEIVAAHEFGHALGLAHSTVPEALMAPYYGYTPNLRLHPDDVQGIQSLYGKKRPTIRSSTTTTSTSTTPTTTTTTSTTTTPTTSTSSSTTPPPPTSRRTTTHSPRPDYCGEYFHVDATVEGPEQGSRYLFRHDKVYKVDSHGLQAGYPRYISHLFPEGPRRHLDAAVYLPESRTHLLFKGHKVWRFKDFRLEEKYPRVWLSFSQFLHMQRQGDLNLRPLYTDYLSLRPSAALSFTYKFNITIIFMFGDGIFWEWDEKRESMVAGYPLQTARYWKGVPAHPEAATSNSHNHFFFFKGNRYFKLRNRFSVGISRPVNRDWFGDDCDTTHDTNAHELLQESNATLIDTAPHSTMISSSSISQPEASETDSTAWADVPVGISEWSWAEVPKERFAPRPFQFVLGDSASPRRESGGYVRGRH